MALGKFGEWWEDAKLEDTMIAIVAIPVPVAGRPSTWYGVEAWFNITNDHVTNVLPKIVRGFKHPSEWKTGGLKRLPIKWEEQVMKALGGWIGLKKMITEWMFSEETK